MPSNREAIAASLARSRRATAAAASIAQGQNSTRQRDVSEVHDNAASSTRVRFRSPLVKEEEAVEDVRLPGSEHGTMGRVLVMQEQIIRRVDEAIAAMPRPDEVRLITSQLGSMARKSRAANDRIREQIEALSHTTERELDIRERTLAQVQRMDAYLSASPRPHPSHDAVSVSSPSSSNAAAVPAVSLELPDLMAQEEREAWGRGDEEEARDGGRVWGLDKADHRSSEGAEVADHRARVEDNALFDVPGQAANVIGGARLAGSADAGVNIAQGSHVGHGEDAKGGSNDDGSAIMAGASNKSNHGAQREVFESAGGSDGSDEFEVHGNGGNLAAYGPI